MITLQNAGSIKRERLVESIAILKNTTLISSQLTILSTYLEKGSKAVLKLVSGGLKGLGKLGDRLQEREGVIGDFGKTLSSLEKEGEKLEQKDVQFSQYLLERLDEETKKLQTLNDEELVRTFIAEIARVADYKGDQENLEELSTHCLKELAGLCKVETAFRQAEVVEKEVYTTFILELARILKKSIEGIKVGKEGEIAGRVAQELETLDEFDSARLKQALGLESLDYQALKQFFLGADLLADKLPDLKQAGFGMFLASALLLKAISAATGVAFPAAAHTLLSAFLAFLLTPVGGIIMAGGIFAFLELKGLTSFNRKLLAYILIPINWEVYARKK